MQCISGHTNGNAAKIKQENAGEPGQKLAETVSLHQHPKHQHITTRTEVHRVIKNQGNGMEEDEDQLNGYAMSSQSPFGSPNSRSYSGGDYGREGRQELQQQRVHVIKDGRYYEEPRQALTPASPPPSVVHQHEESSPPLPPLMPVQQTESNKRIVVNRQVIVNAQNTGPTVEPRESANAVFRPPVVSSSCQSMRPPPPPPPKLKGSASEEPSSSIPDLGKSMQTLLFYSPKLIY